MSELLKRLKKATAKAVETKVMSQTDYYDYDKYGAPSDLLIYNLALSGKLRRAGLTPGVTILSGQSKSYKTVSGIQLVKAYMDKYEDAVCIFYDSELGGPGYWEAAGIDTDRVVHIVIRHLEELKFDLQKKLDEIKHGEHVIFFIDSIGMLASKKELLDAQNEHSAQDMTRAKEIKAVFRQITPTINDLHLPLIGINNNYASMDKYNPEAMGGGGGIVLAANTVLFFGKFKLKQASDSTAVGTELAGHIFRITIFKSRFIKEGTKLHFRVLYGKSRPNKYSGLWELATVTKDIYSPSKGWRAARLVDENGVELPKEQHPKFRESEMYTNEDFWENTMFKRTNFEKNIENRLSLTYEVPDGEVDTLASDEVPYDPESGEILEAVADGE